MKTIFIAGSWGSGTTAVAGMLDQLGASSVPPHFETSDNRTMDTHESLAFREIIYRYTSERSMRTDISRLQEIKDAIKKFREELDSEVVTL